MFIDLKNNLTEIEFSSSEYPLEWKALTDAPKRLYALGDVSLLRKRKFTVVGSRRTPANALKIGAQIVKDVSEAFVIVTGTADGGDNAAIEGALAGSGKIICVLAGGFSALPQANLSLLQRVAQKGLLLSPHEFETPVRSFSYEYRNKLLAALGEGTLVLGAAEKSGALITARYAESFGKKIFALPYAPGSSAGGGCNALIKKGGYLTENSVDILGRFGINLIEKKSTVSLTADEEKLYEALKDLSEGHINELASRSGVPAFKARGVLSALEVKGLAVSLGGNRYSVC
ncbi:MAG: DNA-protecting protein DprA [Clostridia bacterium]|nr:DNA-protecting protein DprA [Clostridia bacterium]